MYDTDNKVMIPVKLLSCHPPIILRLPYTTLEFVYQYQCPCTLYIAMSIIIHCGLINLSDQLLHMTDMEPIFIILTLLHGTWTFTEIYTIIPIIIGIIFTRRYSMKCYKNINESSDPISDCLLEDHWALDEINDDHIIVYQYRMKQ